MTKRPPKPIATDGHDEHPAVSHGIPSKSFVECARCHNVRLVTDTWRRPCTRKEASPEGVWG